MAAHRYCDYRRHEHISLTYHRDLVPRLEAQASAAVASVLKLVVLVLALVVAVASVPRPVASVQVAALALGPRLEVPLDLAVGSVARPQVLAASVQEAGVSANPLALGLGQRVALASAAVASASQEVALVPRGLVPRRLVSE